jgi:four helix bundle protein
MQLCGAVYALTQEFPKHETYGLSGQARRAAVSIASNIAEGHGRGTTLQLIQFLRMARGSNFELLTQLLLSRDLGYGTPQHLQTCEGLCDEVSRMLNATITSLKAKHAATKNPKPPEPERF